MTETSPKPLTRFTRGCKRKAHKECMGIDKGTRWTKTGRHGAPLEFQVASEVFDLMDREPAKKLCVLVEELGVRPVRRMRVSTLLRDWTRAEPGATA